MKRQSVGGGGKGRIETGVLALVVGPSGAGKDTLIEQARHAFGRDARMVFARRTITRASDGVSEDNDAVDRAQFDADEAAGRYLLSWRAHGLGYAIPGQGENALRQGKVLVANVSRTVIGNAELRARHVVVLHVTAPIDVLAQRIAARGRESREEITSRLARQPPLQASSAGVVEIINDREPEHAAAQFNDVLIRLAAQAEARG